MHIHPVSDLAYSEVVGTAGSRCSLSGGSYLRGVGARHLPVLKITSLRPAQVCISCIFSGPEHFARIQWDVHEESIYRIKHLFCKKLALFLMAWD